MRSPTWVLGYHGCDRKVGELVLSGKTALRPSRNDWDWLGTGIYFWENNAQRALDWAEYLRAHPEASERVVKVPFVLGAIIDLGNCLDLLELESIRLVNNAHEEMSQLFAASSAALPVNSGHDSDRVIRRLDCAVVNFLHRVRLRDEQEAFDSVRAAFVEGTPLYEGAGFHNRTHIQICVRDEEQIIGYFRVRER